MARVPYLEIEDLAAGDRDLLKRPITLFKALANSPGMARTWQHFGEYIRNDSPLDPRLRELGILMIGYLTRSPYEYSHHLKLGIERFGVSEDDVHRLIREAESGDGGFPELETTVLRAAREMVEDAVVSEATFTYLAGKLPKDHLVDLFVTLGFYCCVIRVLATFQIDVEDDYMPYLEKFPLPDMAYDPRAGL